MQLIYKQESLCPGNSCAPVPLPATKALPEGLGDSWHCWGQLLMGRGRAEPTKTLPEPHRDCPQSVTSEEKCPWGEPGTQSHCEIQLNTHRIYGENPNQHEMLRVSLSLGCGLTSGHCRDSWLLSQLFSGGFPTRDSLLGKQSS